MTREDMLTVINHYLRGASTKSVLESEDIRASRREIHSFLIDAAEWVEFGIEAGKLN